MHIDQKRTCNNYRWRRQVHRGASSFLRSNTRVPPDGESSSTSRRAPGRRSARRCYPNFGRHQGVIREPPVRESIRNAQEITIGRRWRRSEPPSPQHSSWNHAFKSWGPGPSFRQPIPQQHITSARTSTSSYSSNISAVWCGWMKSWI